ncbi:MAG: NHL repeat-containing protein [Ardenticatenales bacterium]
MPLGTPPNLSARGPAAPAAARAPRQRHRPRRALAVLAILPASAIALLYSTAAAQTLAPPTVRRTLGIVPPIGQLNDPHGIAASRAEDGRFYVVDGANARIQVFSPSALPLGEIGTRGDAVGRGELWQPADVAVSPDGRYIYVVDRGTRKVIRFTPDLCLPPENRPTCASGSWGGRGRGNTLFESPVGLATDREGRVYVVDQATDEIKVFDADGAHVRTFGGSGSGNGELLQPTDVDVAADGTVWVADRDNDRLVAFKPNGDPQTTFTGLRQSMFHPDGVAVGPGGRMLVVDHSPEDGSQRVTWYENNKQLWQVPLDGGPSIERGAPIAGGVAFMADGRGIVANPRSLEYSLYLANGDGALMPFALRGQERAQFDLPTDVAIDDQFYVIADKGNGRVLIMDPKRGESDVMLGGLYQQSIDMLEPTAVAVWRTGPEWVDARIYIVDPARNSVFVVKPDGQVIDRWGSGEPRRDPEGFSEPYDVAVGPTGEVFVADRGNGRIVRRSPDGRLLGFVGEPGDLPGQLRYPIGVTVGPDGLVYTLEYGKSRIQAFTPDGQRAGIWIGASEPIQAELGLPWSPVSLAADDRFVYILENDQREHVRVQAIRPRAGALVIGDLAATFGTTPGPNEGELWNPLGIAARGKTVVVADAGNNRLEVYEWGDDPIGPPTTAAPPTEPPSATPPPPSATPTLDPSPSATPDGPPPATATPSATTAPTDAPSATATTHPPDPTGTVASTTPSPSATHAPDTATATATATIGTPPASPPGPSEVASRTPAPTATATEHAGGGTMRVYLPRVYRAFRVR